MKKYLLFIALLFACNGLSAQHTDSIHVKVTNILKEHYNQNDYDLIFEMFSNEMRTSLPLDKTMAFFAGLKSKAGNLLLLKLTQSNSSTVAYTADFEKDTLLLKITFNSQHDITGLYFDKPSPSDGGKHKNTSAEKRGKDSVKSDQAISGDR